MTDDERNICYYLKACPGTFVSFREVGRRAGGKHRFQYEPRWHETALQRLVQLGVVEGDEMNGFRLRKRSSEKKRVFLCPQVRRMLEASQKDFKDLLEPEDLAEFYGLEATP